MIKKIISIFVFTSLFFWFFQNNSNAKWNNDKTYFRVTAYYSPLPNQSHYIKWNYEKEIIMNGKWIKWASGKKVFSWMIAAPSKYSFWTKIKLKWLWIAEVSDRWGAIVKSWERNFKYDRIDIWCGYWEKWLQRAMFWGNRVIEWEIVSRKTKTNLNIKNIPAPRWTIYHAIKNPNLIKTKTVENKIYLSAKKETKVEKLKTIKKDLFSWPIQDKDWVKNLQEILKKMKLYSWKINWEYSSIRKIILDFQLKNKVISKNNEKWAWNFWPKTRKTLKEKYNLFLKNKELEEKKAKQEKKIKLLLEKKKKISFKKYTKKIKNLWNLKFWDISYNVRQLQIILKRLWFFKYKDTAIFWEKTKKALINYQISKKLIINSKSRWAWVFWPNTKKSLIEDLTEKSLEK